MAGSDTLITNSTQLKALLHHDIRVPVDFGKDIFATVSYRSLLRLLTAGPRYCLFIEFGSPDLFNTRPTATLTSIVGFTPDDNTRLSGLTL